MLVVKRSIPVFISILLLTQPVLIPTVKAGAAAEIVRLLGSPRDIKGGFLRVLKTMRDHPSLADRIRPIIKKPMAPTMARIEQRMLTRIIHELRKSRATDDAHFQMASIMFLNLSRRAQEGLISEFEPTYLTTRGISNRLIRRLRETAKDEGWTLRVSVEESELHSVENSLFREIINLFRRRKPERHETQIQFDIDRFGQALHPHTRDGTALKIINDLKGLYHVDLLRIMDDHVHLIENETKPFLIDLGVTVDELAQFLSIVEPESLHGAGFISRALLKIRANLLLLERRQVKIFQQYSDGIIRRHELYHPDIQRLHADDWQEVEGIVRLLQEKIPDPDQYVARGAEQINSIQSEFRRAAGIEKIIDDMSAAPEDSVNLGLRMPIDHKVVIDLLQEIGDVWRDLV